MQGPVLGGKKLRLGILKIVDMQKAIINKRNSRQFMSMMVIINAIIMREAFVTSENLYWVLALTLPLMVYTVLWVSRAVRKKKYTRNTGSAPDKSIFKPQSELIKTSSYDYAKF
jgi:hypothetical protein